MNTQDTSSFNVSVGFNYDYDGSSARFVGDDSFLTEVIHNVTVFYSIHIFDGEDTTTISVVYQPDGDAHDADILYFSEADDGGSREAIGLMLELNFDGSDDEDCVHECIELMSDICDAVDSIEKIKIIRDALMNVADNYVTVYDVLDDRYTDDIDDYTYKGEDEYDHDEEADKLTYGLGGNSEADKEEALRLFVKSTKDLILKKQE